MMSEKCVFLEPSSKNKRTSRIRCHLTVRSTRQNGGMLQDFVDFADSNPNNQGLSFNVFIPYPEEFEILDDIAKVWRKANPKSIDDGPKDGFSNGGSIWCINNWGTAYDAHHIDRFDIFNSYFIITVHYDFETVLSPPINVIKKMVECFPELDYNLRYTEEHFKFEGNYSVIDGCEKWTEGSCNIFSLEQHISFFKGRNSRGGRVYYIENLENRAGDLK